MSKEKIKEAALELFRRYSYVKTSVADIATASGIGKGTIYLSYNTKEEILFSILDDDIARVRERDDAFFFDPAVSIEAKLDRYAENFITFHYNIRDLMFGSLENVQGKELQDVYNKFAAYIEKVTEFWLEVLSIHGKPKSERLKENIREMILFLSGRFIVYILSHDWNSRDEIKQVMPRWARDLHRAMIEKESTIHV